jgi:hypothetical protein
MDRSSSAMSDSSAMSGSGEILFGGRGRGSRLETKVRPRSATPSWWEILEEAFFQLTSTADGRALYGDPNKGATLEQAYRAQFAISGVDQVCLLATGRPRAGTASIPRTVLLSPTALVETLARAFTLDPHGAAQLFVYDGRSGHSITLLGHDAATKSFTYHDPWPGRSLLCEEQNAAGVAAQPAEDGRWRITAKELNDVIFAAFIWPTVWADLTGVSYAISYEALMASEFRSFFHLRERERVPISDNRTRVRLETGGFAEFITLHVELDENGRLRSGTLELTRSWMIGPPYGINPFALDIAKSFIAALTPPPDVEDAKELVGAIWSLRAPPSPNWLEEQRQKPAAGTELILAYLGVVPESSSFMPFSRLEAANVELGGTPVFRLTMALH